MKNRSFRLALLSVFSAVGLSGCVSTSYVDQSYQKIAFTASGVEKAGCYAYAGDVKYHFSVPGELKARKSGDMLRVTCMSSNRTVDVNIPPSVKEKPVWAGSAGVGYNTKTLYSYPTSVNVDFGVFSVPAVSSMTLAEDSIDNEPVTSAVMLPDLPPENPPAAQPEPQKDTKGNFMSLLKDLNTKPAEEPAVADKEDSDVVEIDPNGGPVSLTKPE